MDVEPRPDQERRVKRSADRREALGHQIAHVMEVLGYDAIVLADDLGFPVVMAGDPELAEMLAESAMWTDRHGPALDRFIYRQLKERYPGIKEHDVVSEVLELPGMPSFCRLTAAGASMVRCVGVHHAATGIRRIWRTQASAAG